MRRVLLAAVLVALAAGSAPPAGAAGIADRARAEGMLRCGAAERPGVADITAGRGASGVAVDICRAVAAAVLGPAGRVSFGLYAAPHSYDGVRRGSDAVAFLTGGEIAEQALGRSVLIGRTVVIDTVGVMVPEPSPVHDLAGLSGETVCLMTGSLGQRALEGAVTRLHLTISRLPFQEDVEMLDAYNAGRCTAAVGEVTSLAVMRQTPGVRQVTSRLLPKALAADAVVAATPQTDALWAAAVDAVVDALMLADSPAAEGLPVSHLPGLRPNWRAEALAVSGSYAAIIRRNLTDRLDLAPGPNALWPSGMLLPPAMR